MIVCLTCVSFALFNVYELLQISANCLKLMVRGLIRLLGLQNCSLIVQKHPL